LLKGASDVGSPPDAQYGLRRGRDAVKHGTFPQTASKMGTQRHTPPIDRRETEKPRLTEATKLSCSHQTDSRLFLHVHGISNDPTRSQLERLHFVSKRAPERSSFQTTRTSPAPIWPSALASGTSESVARDETLNGAISHHLTISCLGKAR
jgi:hypothetical protein